MAAYTWNLEVTVPINKLSSLAENIQSLLGQYYTQDSHLRVVIETLPFDSTFAPFDSEFPAMPNKHETVNSISSEKSDGD